MTNIASPTTIPVPLPPIAHDYAKQNAMRQSNNNQAQRVYRRTLAVYAVHSYLRCVNIATDLEDSDLWNEFYSNLSNSANLDLPGIGQLECCPVLPGAESFVPPQITGRDRIVYVAVQFKEVLDEVELIGFRPILNSSAPPTEIFIDNFQEVGSSYNGYSLLKIEHLLEYLYWIEDLRQGIETAKVPAITTIRQWLEKQAYSLSQFSVNVVASLQGCEPDLVLDRAWELLFGSTDLTPQLLSSKSAPSEDGISDDSEDESLRKITEEFVEWLHTTIL